jgi:hypothetical protein
MQRLETRHEGSDKQGHLALRDHTRVSTDEGLEQDFKAPART